MHKLNNEQIIFYDRPTIIALHYVCILSSDTKIHRMSMCTKVYKHDFLQNNGKLFH